MTSLTAGGVACRISTPFTDQTATTEQFDNLATRRAGVPPLDHVGVRPGAGFFLFFTGSCFAASRSLVMQIFA